MCVVSNIGDYYRRNYPEWPAFPPALPSDDELVKKLQKFRDLIKAGEEADKAAGDGDCEKGEVKDYIKQVLQRLDAIEKRLAKIEDPR